LFDLLDVFYQERVKDPRWFVSGRDHKISCEGYREAAHQFEEHRHRLAWLHGVATDQAKDKKGMAASTLWDTCGGSGHQSVLSKATEVLEKIAKHKNRRQAIQTTLLGPWARQDACKAMGWDDYQNVSNARLGMSVEDLPPQSELMALVLAIESLALYPVGSHNGQARTAGTLKNLITWATWGSPVGYDTVVAIIDHPALHEEKPDYSMLRALGFTGVFRAFKSGESGRAKQISRSCCLFEDCMEELG